MKQIGRRNTRRSTEIPSSPSSAPAPPRPKAKDKDKDKNDPTPGNTEQLEAGNLVFLEGMLLAFPVRSLTGVFRWVTSPMLVSRLRRVMHALESPLPDAFTCPEPGKDDVLVYSNESGPLSLEDLVFPSERCKQRMDVDTLAKEFGPLVSPKEDDPDRKALSERLVVVSDDVLQDLTRRGTAVTARIVLDHDKKTSNNLWYEETLPSDTLFAVVIGNRPGVPNRKEMPVMQLKRALKQQAGFQADGRYTQIGGNVTVGQGLVRWVAPVEVSQ